MPKENLFKVLVIGDGKVGKTSFVRRYVNDTFSKDYKGTLGVDFALKVITLSANEVVKLQLWDIAGQERFTNLTRVYYKNAHACIIVFDLTNRESFENVVKWKEDLDSKCSLPDGSLIPCILLANKRDLPNWQVTTSEVEQLSGSRGFLGHTEISVKDNIMINEPMTFLVSNLMNKGRARHHSDVGVGDELSDADGSGGQQHYVGSIRITPDMHLRQSSASGSCRC